MTARSGRDSRYPQGQPHGLARRLGPVPVWLAVGMLVATVAIVAVAAVNTLAGAGDLPVSGRGGAPGDAPLVRHDVGQPGVGEAAPDFALPASAAGTFRLSEQRGKNVLLYFHEGLMCAPCWRQIDDIEADLAKFREIGLDEIVAISIDPADAQQQRAQLRGISFPVLADPDLAVSRLYDALSYGMMGGTRPGHTFILVGPDGSIRWRADYGGPPDFTMYVPNATVLAELRRVMAGAGQVAPARPRL